LLTPSKIPPDLPLGGVQSHKKFLLAQKWANSSKRKSFLLVSSRAMKSRW
jgi:hypothetical protein